MTSAELRLSESVVQDILDHAALPAINKELSTFLVELSVTSMEIALDEATATLTVKRAGSWLVRAALPEVVSVELSNPELIDQGDRQILRAEITKRANLTVVLRFLLPFFSKGDDPAIANAIEAVIDGGSFELPISSYIDGALEEPYETLARHHRVSSVGIEKGAMTLSLSRRE